MKMSEYIVSNLDLNYTALPQALGDGIQGRTLISPLTVMLELQCDTPTKPNVSTFSGVICTLRAFRKYLWTRISAQKPNTSCQ